MYLQVLCIDQVCINKNSNIFRKRKKGGNFNDLTKT